MFDFETTVTEIELKVRRLIEENNQHMAAEAEAKQLCRQLQKQIDEQNILINNL